MPKYKHKPIVVEAVQWLKLGDHPDVIMFTPGIWQDCDYCDFPAKEHGWLDDRWNESNVIHPGDWIITHESGRVEILTDNEFKVKYEPLQYEIRILTADTRWEDV